MGKRLFGTDGIRGAVGIFPLDTATVYRLGAALTRLLTQRGSMGRVVIGYDTRESSAPLCAALVAGIHREGGDAAVAGVLPTPGVARLTRQDGFDAGVVISASHNPFSDNGIKIFSGDGTKMSDDDEAIIEASLLDSDIIAGDTTCMDNAPRGSNGTAPVFPAVGANARLADHYVHHLLEAARVGNDLEGVRLVVDCANGAAVDVAPHIFAELGIKVRFLNNDPDGRNINRDCGSLHPAVLIRAVRECNADAGLALDGDADRCLVVDDSGRLLDGDFILYLTGLHLQRRGKLRNSTVVATVMSNLWLEQTFRAEGINLLRTDVGDKYVLEEMVRGDHVLGGEQSGHIIFRDRATTGDGLLTGLRLLDVWRTSGKKLSELVAGIEPCPQILLNVRVKSKPVLGDHPALARVIRRAGEEMGSRGRVLVRYSGTEPLARVMTEGNDADEIRRIAEEVAAELRNHLG
jgi:phosphoglucosamine mutase